MARHVPEVTEWKDRNKRIPAIADLSGGIGSYNKLSLGKHEGRPILNKIKKLEDEQAGIENMKSTLIRSSAHAKGKKVANKEIKTSTIIGDNANLNRSERAYDKFNKRYWDNYEKINKLKEKPVHAIKMPSDVDTFME
jgi:hypothetical protein